MMESATNKLLHAPTTRLRASASESDGTDLVRAAQHLFDLPENAQEEEAAEAPAPEQSEKRLPH
jgi:hypothetical protein